MSIAIDRGKLDPINIKFHERTQTIKNDLSLLAADRKRPNSALQALTIIALMDLSEAAVRRPQQMDQILDEIKDILLSSRDLASYPVEPLVTIIQELGQHITESTSYDVLFETLIKLTEQRASEAEAGKSLLTRGIQKLQAGKNYEAIRLLGRAQQKLAMDE